MYKLTPCTCAAQQVYTTNNNSFQLVAGINVLFTEKNASGTWQKSENNSDF